MRKKYPHLVRNKYGVLRVTPDGKSEGDYIRIMGWTSRSISDELFMFHPVYTYINKTVTDFTARPFYNRFSKTEKVYELPKLQEIKGTKTSKSKRYGTNTNVSLNPEQYPVDLSQKTYDQKLASIAKSEKKCVLNQNSWPKKTQSKGTLWDHYNKKIIETLRVKPTINPEEEIRKTVDF